MSKIVSKGTIVKHSISQSIATIGQCISADHSGAEVQTYDSSDLETSGSGIEYANTGFSEGGTVDLEIFFDPALASHQSITDTITTPVETSWQILFSDSSLYSFNAAGLSFGFTVALNDGLKSSISLKLDQTMTYTT